MYKQNKVKWKGNGSYNHNSHYGVKISRNEKLKINIAL